MNDNINLDILPPFLRERIENAKNEETSESEDDGLDDEQEDDAIEDSSLEDLEGQEADDEDDGQESEEKSSDPAKDGRKRKQELDSKLADEIDKNTKFLEEASRKNREALEILQKSNQELEDARKKHEELSKTPDKEEQEDNSELIELLGEEGLNKLLEKQKRSLIPLQKELEELKAFRSKQDEISSQSAQKEKQLNAFKESGAWDLMLDDGFQKFLKSKAHDDYSTSYSIVVAAIESADKEKINSVVKPLHDEYKEANKKTEEKAKADPKINQTNKSSVAKRNMPKKTRQQIEAEINKAVFEGREADVIKLYEQLEISNED